MTNFLKNDTEEGKNDPDRANAGKKRPLLYIGIGETAWLLDFRLSRSFNGIIPSKRYRGLNVP